MEDYGYIFLYTIILISGLISYKKYNHNLLLKLWLCFLVYSFFTEIGSRYIIESYNVRAMVLVNAWWSINSFFYLLFFLSLIKSTRKKKYIRGMALVLGIYLIISILFYKDIRKDYLVDSCIVGQLFVIASIMFYYSELLLCDSTLNLKYSLFFWISIGALIFNLGILPVFVIGELIDYQGIFRYIIFGLNIFLSLSFITGFLISKKEYN